MAQKPGFVIVNAHTLKLIGVVVVVLGAVLFFMDSTDKRDTVADGETLLPELRAQINAITKISVTMSDKGEALTLVNNGNTWVVTEKDDFPADVGKIRKVLLAIADAKTIERKTANPDRYEQLGVDETGTRVKIDGPGFTYEIIVGKSAQSNYRYVRLASQQQSWLIDKNPDLPADSGGWLKSDIIDIDASRVSAVRITHSSGDQIRLSKAAAEDTNFTVEDIPEGRELSYPTVANGIGGALNDLKLDDVRKGTPASEAVLTVVDTFDGLQVTVQSEKTDDETWIALSATGSGESATEADAINAAVAGWLYRVPTYKANLLVRNWADILKAVDSE